jgi:hypothetical protein
MKKRNKSPIDKYEERYTILLQLVNDNKFLDQNSIQYSAAMYLLIRALEEKISAEKSTPAQAKIYSRLNQLRNGLVHGFFKVMPIDVRYFVQVEANNLFLNKPLTNNLDYYLLFQKVKGSKPSAVKDTILETFQSLSAPNITQEQAYNYSVIRVLSECYDGMRTSKELIHNFSNSQESENVIKYAKLYQIACFSETVKQINESNLEASLDQILVATTSNWRNQIFHDTGTKIQGNLTFNAEISSETILGWINTIKLYDHDSRTILTPEEFKKRESQVTSSRSEHVVAVTIKDDPIQTKTHRQDNSEYLDTIDSILSLESKIQIKSNGALRKHFENLKSSEDPILQNEGRQCIEIQINSNGDDFSKTEQNYIKLALGDIKIPFFCNSLEALC